MQKALGVLVLIAIGFGAYYFMRNNPSSDSSDFYSNLDSGNQPAQNASQPNDNQVSGEQTAPPVASEKAVATIETSEGSFQVTLDGKAAPLTVANFIKLAEDGYYAGTKFHRIIENFMIQGGDPNSKDNDPANDGQGGPGYTVPAEIGLKHTKGAIAMARTPDSVNPQKASSGSQFYVTLDVQAFLDGEYTVFGYVTSGMDVVEKIGRTPVEPNMFTGEPSTPLQDVVIKKITIK